MKQIKFCSLKIKQTFFLLLLIILLDIKTSHSSKDVPKIITETVEVGATQQLSEKPNDDGHPALEEISTKCQEQMMLIMKEKFAGLQENHRSQMKAVMKEHQEELSRISSKHKHQLEHLETSLRVEINSLKNHSNLQEEQLSKLINNEKEKSNKNRPAQQSPKVNFRKKRSSTSLVANNHSCTYYHPDHPDAEIPKIGKKDEAVKQPPTNCADLYALGHTLNGFYPVQGTQSKVTDQMVFIHCIFSVNNATSPVFKESTVGSVDFKCGNPNDAKTTKQPTTPSQKKTKKQTPAEPVVNQQGKASNDDAAQGEEKNDGLLGALAG